jgi:dihydrofolate reductase
MELSVNTFVSLDGVMQGPGAVQEDPSNGFERGGWVVPHSDAGQLDPVDGWFRQADALLLGRTTFEMMRAYWSEVTDPDNLVATALNTGQKYVVSSTLSDADAAWGNTTVLRGDVPDHRVGGAERGCGCGLAHPAPGRVRRHRHRRVRGARRQGGHRVSTASRRGSRRPAAS